MNTVAIDVLLHEIYKAFHRMDFKAFVAAVHFHIQHFHSHPGT
jgi:hypothetical protein